MFNSQKQIEVRVGYMEDEIEALKREVESLREELRDLARLADRAPGVSPSDRS
jgi:HAMP domain-containing protein